MKILFSSNISWSIYNFRKDLLLSLQNDGFEIYCAAKPDEYATKLEELGFCFHPIQVENNSKNPFKDLRLLWAYFKLYRSVKPDIILHNAIKPNIYGTIIAGILNIPVVNNISGLGTLFIRKSFSTKLAKFLYKFSQRYATIVLFQNKYDRQLFIEGKLVKEQKCKLIQGSGVDTKKFVPLEKLQTSDTKFNFLFVGRLLKDKGLIELLEASKILFEEGFDFKLTLLGGLYKDNETSISETVFKEWQKEPFIEYLAPTDDVITVMQKASCLVLPSYREGLSKVLIEASSIGLPIITTDVPGCRDVVTHGETGFLCQARNTKDLATKMEMMLKLPLDERLKMGIKGREKAKAIFDISIIIQTYKNEIQNILK